MLCRQKLLFAEVRPVALTPTNTYDWFEPPWIGVLEDTRNHTLHGILRVQSCFRGHQARCYLKELRRGIATLQSFVRGEKTRKEYAILQERHRVVLLIQKHIKGRIGRKSFENTRHASILLQSGDCLSVVLDMPGLGFNADLAPHSLGM
ncbi:unnamed protein product [Ilex paraguariensis]|uniref:Uncharacterized protein n=1 Tax=Ilex paraguariensis TaxID=185542 RepID=A0ABC8UMW1_9AQUA